MNLTKEQEKEMVRVCGKDFKEIDIPTILRNNAKGESMQEWVDLHGASQDEEGDWSV